MTSSLPSIGIMRMGPSVPDVAVHVIRGHIAAKFHLPTSILSPFELPMIAYDSFRKQYNAAMLIKEINKLPRYECSKLIAVLNVDLFVPIFTYVFGEAKMNGDVGLVSLYRLGFNNSKSSVENENTLYRAATVTLHELGHLLSLFHCSDKRCLMYYSGTVEELDLIPHRLCRYCATYLSDVLHKK